MEPTSVLMYSIQLVLILALQFTDGFGFGKSDKVLLENVKTLTLHKDRMTTGRRSSPVPQMACVGGSAGCSSFQPQVVQCYNRGSDGYDIQWECKTDMDNAYRFGKVEVTCEGYDYPDDPYVLAGSCGLEYTLDLTKEGMNQGNQQHHNYYGSSGGNYHGNSHHDYYSSYSNKKRSTFGDWIMLAICGLIIYGIYKSCVTTGHTGGTYPDDDHSRRGGSSWGGGGGPGSPPPPGFRPEYQPDSCSGTQGAGTGARGGGWGLGGGNFWTGAATGGLMGYLFGNRFGGYNRGYNHGYGGSDWGGYGYSRPRTYRQPSYGSGFSGFGGGGFSSGGRSTGTRTASGFGGTRRR